MWDVLPTTNFINVCDQTDEHYFNLFFDRLIPCVAGRKVFTDRDKIDSKITESGKISITDEAFTELCIMNYWDKWLNNGQAVWTDSRGGNTPFHGWKN